MKECALTNTTTTATDDRSLGDKKLKLAGYSYVLGDAAMMAAGMARGKKFSEEVLGGAIWAAGGVAAARYGNPDSEKQLELLANKLERHLKKAGYGIPDEVRAQNTLLKKETFWQRIEDFLYEHPSEVLNGAYAIGAASILKDAIPKMKSPRELLPSHLGKGGLQGMNTNFWIGALVLAGSVGGLLIKEDKHARENAKEGSTLDKVKAFFQEKPLRWSGTLYTANNLFLAAKAKQDWNKRGDYAGLKPHLFSTLQLGTYLFSNIMLFLSSRDQIAPKGMVAEDLARIEDAAARMIGAQVPQVQQALLADVSQYLATQKGVQQKPEEIAQALATRITEITGERMHQAAGKVSWAEREKARVTQAAELETAGATR